ncbi:jg90, partial [Pararge aegeria aegeria]
ACSCGSLIFLQFSSKTERVNISCGCSGFKRNVPIAEVLFGVEYTD